MTGYEFLKEKRNEHRYSVRGFALNCGIAPRMVTYYENGTKSITSISVVKALRYFDLLDLNPVEFFDTYYHFLRETKENVRIWKEKHPREYEVKALKQRFYLRLSKIKERDSVSLREFDKLSSFYKKVFSEDLQDKLVLTDEEYEKYILELNYRIRAALKPDMLQSDDRIRTKLSEALFHTDYSIQDLSMLCGVTGQHLRSCFDGEHDMQSIRISLALKLCLILNIPFDPTFTAHISI